MAGSHVWAFCRRCSVCSWSWVLTCGDRRGQWRNLGSGFLSEGTWLLRNCKNSSEQAGERDCSKSLHRLYGGAYQVWSALGFQNLKGFASESAWLWGWLTHRKSLSFKNLHHDVWKTDQLKSAGPIHSLLSFLGLATSSENTKRWRWLSLTHRVQALTPRSPEAY